MTPKIMMTTEVPPYRPLQCDIAEARCGERRDGEVEPST